VLVALAFAVTPAHAAFPGKNGKIGFSRSNYYGNDIWAVSPNAGGEINITNNRLDNEDTSWSPDGTKIAFASSEFCDECSLEVYVMNADGSDAKKLTIGGARWPSWSPDGTAIVYWQYGLRIVNADGSDDRRLTNIDGYNPAWSPDGSEIAFSLVNDIFVIHPDGTGLTNLTNEPAGSIAFNANPSWSPDGKRIAFDRDTPSAPTDVYVMSADGRVKVRLTDNPVPDRAPAWSPDGTKIAFETTRDGNNEIYTMDPDGTGQTRVTTNPAQDVEADWQPIPGPERSDYKNAAQYCNADAEFLGDRAFRQNYGTNGNGADALGKCVRQNQ
jgi:Tol biopolymer transport system component